MLAVVEHGGEDVLRVLEALSHFGVVAVQSLAEGHHASLSLLVNVGDLAALRVEQDFGAVLEVHLYDFIRKAEHRRMVSLHPFFDVDASRLARSAAARV